METLLLPNKGFKFIATIGGDVHCALRFLGVTTPTVASGLRFDGLIQMTFAIHACYRVFGSGNVATRVNGLHVRLTQPGSYIDRKC